MQRSDGWAERDLDAILVEAEMDARYGVIGAPRTAVHSEWLEYGRLAARGVERLRIVLDALVRGRSGTLHPYSFVLEHAGRRVAVQIGSGEGGWSSDKDALQGKQLGSVVRFQASDGLERPADCIGVLARLSPPMFTLHGFEAALRMAEPVCRDWPLERVGVTRIPLPRRSDEDDAQPCDLRVIRRTRRWAARDHGDVIEL